MSPEDGEPAPRKSVRYQLTTAFTVRGLNAADTDLTLVEDGHFRAWLTRDWDTHLIHADRSQALKHYLLRRQFGGSVPPTDVTEAVAIIVDEIRVERRKRIGKSGLLLITVHGETEVALPTRTEELPDFIFWRNGGNRQELIEAHARPINALIAAITIHNERVDGIVNLAESVVYFQHDGKPIYTSRPKLSGTGYVSGPVEEDTATEIQGLYKQLNGPVGLDTPTRLLRLGFDKGADDRFQAFWHFWLSLEIFVQKVFPLYDDHVQRSGSFLSNRFVAVATALDPNGAPADLRVFNEVKRVRDTIAHQGKDILPNELPLEQARMLSRKYLKLHLTCRRLPSST